MRDFKFKAIAGLAVVAALFGVAATIMAHPQEVTFSPSRGSIGVTGTNGTNGSNGAAGSAGIVCYNSSGVITGCKQWVGTATVNSSGVWTVSNTSAGFTNVLWSQFGSTAPANGGSVNIASGSCTTTTCSGTATGALNVLGILTLSLNNISGSTISVQAIGN